MLERFGNGNGKICGGDIIGNLLDGLGIKIQLNVSTGELFFEEVNGKYKYIWICPEKPTGHFSCTQFDKINFSTRCCTSIQNNEILECIYQIILTEKCYKIKGITKRNVQETIFTIPQFNNAYELKIKLDMLGKKR